MNSDAIKSAAEEFIDAVDDWQKFGCTKERATERIVSAYLAALTKQLLYGHDYTNLEKKLTSRTKPATRKEKP